jgi:hypothetical protein
MRPNEVDNLPHLEIEAHKAGGLDAEVPRAASNVRGGGNRLGKPLATTWNKRLALDRSRHR